MKPKNKKQREIVKLSNALKPISQGQINYAEKHMHNLTKVTAKGQCTCLRCGHSWTLGKTETLSLKTAKAPKLLCPNCLEWADVTFRRVSNYMAEKYFAVFSVVDKYQLIRYFLFTKQMVVGKAAQFNHTEVCQHWIDDKGFVTIFAKSRTCNFYNYSWCWNSELSIKAKLEEYAMDYPLVYPRFKVLDKIKRNGFAGNLHGLKPIDFFVGILKNSKAETLLKAKQIPLFRKFCIYQPTTEEWSAIKICIRNKYQVKDVSLYLDYLRMLKLNNKDLHNAKFVCPDNLKTAHDKIIAEIHRKNEIQERKKMLRKRNEI